MLLVRERFSLAEKKNGDSPGLPVWILPKQGLEQWCVLFQEGSIFYFLANLAKVLPFEGIFDVCLVFCVFHNH